MAKSAAGMFGAGLENRIFSVRKVTASGRSTVTSVW